jgi:hypothetical protein
MKKRADDIGFLGRLITKKRDEDIAILAKQIDDIEVIAKKIADTIKTANPAADVKEAEIAEDLLTTCHDTVGPEIIKRMKYGAKQIVEINKCARKLERLLKESNSNFLLFNKLDVLFVARRLKDDLSDLQKACGEAIERAAHEPDLQRHGNSGIMQEHAATFAANLMTKHGLKLEAYSDTSPYREVAGLVFEALTGKPPSGSDIRRACKRVAARWKARG